MANSTYCLEFLRIVDVGKIEHIDTYIPEFFLTWRIHIYFLEGSRTKWSKQHLGYMQSSAATTTQAFDCQSSRCGMCLYRSMFASKKGCLESTHLVVSPCTKDRACSPSKFRVFLLLDDDELESFCSAVKTCPGLSLGPALVLSNRGWCPKCRARASSQSACNSSSSCCLGCTEEACCPKPEVGFWGS
jgi:hypothetical protein